jgi:hypothetical protein
VTPPSAPRVTRDKPQLIKTTPDNKLELITLTLPLPENIANKTSGRSHWSVTHRAKKAYYAACDERQRCGLVPPPPREPFAKATIRATLYVFNHMDEGNAMHRVEKWPCDWLKTRGYIKDDRRSCLKWEGFPTQIVKRDGKYRVEITLQECVAI